MPDFVQEVHSCQRLCGWVKCAVSKSRGSVEGCEIMQQFPDLLLTDFLSMQQVVLQGPNNPQCEIRWCSFQYYSLEVLAL